MGDYHDTTLQVLADKGNGQYAYIDNLAEARKQLVDGCTGMLVTIAKDVKLQVEFNPATVASWRLLGYEKRHLEQQEFLDDHADGGELGAGHALTALYEIIPAGQATSADVPSLRYASDDTSDGVADAAVVDESRPVSREVPSDDAAELLTVSLRWKLHESDVSSGISLPISDDHRARPSVDFMFAAAVVEFAQVMRGSAGSWSLDRALSAAQATAGDSVQRREFIELVRTAQRLGAR